MTFLINSATALRSEKFAVALGAFVPALDSSLAGFTLVTKYAAKALKAGGTGVRLTLQGPVTEGNVCTISKVTISLAATAATSKAYDSLTTPTNVTFGGSDSVTLARGGQRVSDEINFAVNVSSAILIAYNVSSTGTNHASLIGGLSASNIVTYRKSGTEAGTAARATGYVALTGHSAFLRKLECFSRTAA